MPLPRKHVKNFIAIDGYTIRTHQQAPVTVAIQRNAHVCAMCKHRRLQSCQMGRATTLIDIQAIRRHPDRDDFGAKLVEYQRSNTVSSPVRAVDDQFQATQRIASKSALAELDIPPLRIIDAPRAAHGFGGHTLEIAPEVALDLLLDGVAELVALARKELNTVVEVRVVRSRNHDAGLRTVGARQIGDGRGRQRPEQVGFDTSRSKPGFERRLEQITGTTRVLADQHARAMRPAEHATGRPAQLQRELRGHRGLADTTANAVRAEELSAHAVIMRCTPVVATQHARPVRSSLHQWSAPRHACARSARHAR